jgi:hypothetical protein
MNNREQEARSDFWQNMVSLDKEYNLETINLVAKDLAYFAGIFDTEVYFTIAPVHNIRLAYDKHNEYLLRTFLSSFGGKIIKAKPRVERKSDIWVWLVTSDQAYKILKKIHPFLRINGEKARLCIECYEECAKSGLSYADKAKIGEKYINLLKDCETKPEQRFDYFGLPHLKLAYLAGMFDVGASFVITKRTERDTYLLEVIKRNDDYETMEFIAGLFGGKIHAASRSKLNKQHIWEIKYASQKAYAVLKQIYPSLKAQKRIADICMEFQDAYWQGQTSIEVSQTRKTIGAKYNTLLRSYHLKWRSRYGK